VLEHLNDPGRTAIDPDAAERPIICVARYLVLYI
jgi:hypothetical protein